MTGPFGASWNKQPFLNCMYCSTRLSARRTVCYQCLVAGGKVDLITDPRCSVCSYPEESPGVPCTNKLCYEYADERRFDRVLAAATLTGDISMMIHILKPKDPAKQPKVHYASVLGGFLSGWLVERPDEVAEYGLIMPMPAHPDRIKELGVDISATLVNSLQRAIPNLEYVVDAGLVATKTHRVEARSHGNSWAERREAVKDAYQLTAGAEKLLSGKSMLVVDDVLTTGLNLDALAGQLLAAGASSVDGLVVARALFSATEGFVG